MLRHLIIIVSTSFLLASPTWGKAVGSCDSEAGCRDLARACGKTKGHTYKPATETSGVCDDGAKAPANAGAFKAEGTDARSSFCNSKALCTNLKTTCRGTYKSLTRNSGTCSN